MTRPAFRGWLTLPLPDDTAVCLACMWMYAGRDPTAAATAHTRATRHPTIARPNQPTTPANGAVPAAG
ncbi:MAG: hypothetical protein AUI14_12980 [Actinobacteria bacterium 13_2_20CM_2_71_6]|nr:MAG: hypothetical protein AUI14_12980 [Actinobacteria bacterium 13_2_20CM_2_71_6]